MSEHVMTQVYNGHVFGEFGDVNPSITDSSTYTFMSPETMKATFSSGMPGCYLYSRHWNPANRNLAQALATIEGCEDALVTGSGMSAISCALLQLCKAGDEIVSSRTIYGGTYALMKHFLPRLGIHTHFVDSEDLAEVEARCNERTRVIYCESISNPLLDVANLPELAGIAHRHGAKLVVDNTFAPLLLRPASQGADVVIHSLTKYINGASDCVAGAVCGGQEFIASLTDINCGSAMLLGPVLDGMRSAGIWKNLHHLHLRMAKHAANAKYLAERFEALGLRVHYPGLTSHRHYKRLQELGDTSLGSGGMLVVALDRAEDADALMTRMQQARVGLLAVSLGYFRTLFSAPGSSTSSEIPDEEQTRMGLSKGMLRISVGLDQDIASIADRIETCLLELGLVGARQV